MNQERLNEILRLHDLWTAGKEGGVRADLSREDLSGANLKNANLSNANLKDANLYYANLKNANLEDANLEDAILKNANLFRANLSYAILFRANLENASLSFADLPFANLKDAILYCANLFRANLTSAILKDADLYDANLKNADLTDTILPDYQICPDGEFIGYKKVMGDVILELRIPADARRTSSLVGRKCRADKAFVVRALNSDEEEFQSLWDPSFIYRVGEMVEESWYSDDIREECLPGIHFFLKREEAEAFFL